MAAALSRPVAAGNSRIRVAARLRAGHVLQHGVACQPHGHGIQVVQGLWRAWHSRAQHTAWQGTARHSVARQPQRPGSPGSTEGMAQHTARHGMARHRVAWHVTVSHRAAWHSQHSRCAVVGRSHRGVLRASAGSWWLQAGRSCCGWWAPGRPAGCRPLHRKPGQRGRWAEGQGGRGAEGQHRPGLHGRGAYARAPMTCQLPCHTEPPLHPHCPPAPTLPLVHGTLPSSPSLPTPLCAPLDAFPPSCPAPTGPLVAPWPPRHLPRIW